MNTYGSTTCACGLTPELAVRTDLPWPARPCPRGPALTCAGSFPALAGLLVDQARVCAEPQATRLTFLP